MSDDLNNLGSRIDARAFFERILREREKIEEQRDLTLYEKFARINDRFAEAAKALKLQAQEYERRLHDLNGEYQRDRQRQNQFVSIDKWESTNDAEALAREAALLRVNEKLEEYITRYEVRQREVDLLLAAQKGAAEEAIRVAEGTARRSNRNLGIASFALGFVVFVANVAPVILK